MNEEQLILSVEEESELATAQVEETLPEDNDTETIYTEAENPDDEDFEDTSELLKEDIISLKEEFPELAELSDIAALPNPTRYAALRDLGLTPKEAYLATAPHKKEDNRSHLRGGVPRAAKIPVSSMTRREWQTARALFEDMSDAEIEKLYRKVTR